MNIFGSIVHAHKKAKSLDPSILFLINELRILRFGNRIIPHVCPRIGPFDDEKLEDVL